MDHKTLSRKLTIEQTTRISMTSEDELSYRISHESERSCICVLELNILHISTILVFSFWFSSGSVVVIVFLFSFFFLFVL